MQLCARCPQTVLYRNFAILVCDFVNVSPCGVSMHVRSTDGYSREWNQVGDLWTDKIHQPCAEGRAPDAVDLVQVTDGTTGEIAFFRFPCEGSSRCGGGYATAFGTGSAHFLPPVSPPPAVVVQPSGPVQWVTGSIVPPPGPPGPPGTPGIPGEVAGRKCH